MAPDRFGWYPPPSRPRPADGIKARSRTGAIGATWWSQRFIAVLEGFNLGARLTRGKRYARAGQVLEVNVAPGAVTARVQGSRPTPYEVAIRLRPLSARDWRRVEAALAARAAFLAALLAGEMPPDIESAFAECRLSLFPAGASDLKTSCSCPDWSNPCKHIAATYYLLAEVFDDDPFLVLAWRGRGRDELLAALLDRTGAPPGAGPDGVGSDEGWLAPVVPVPDLADCLDSYYDQRGTLPAPVAAAPGFQPDAVLLELDDPSVDLRGHPLAELLRPAYPAMADAARELITGG